MKNRIYLYFTIADFEDITHDEITQKLGISPQKTYVKGAKRYPGSDNSTLVRRNRWIINSTLDEYHTFEDQMNALLDIIEPRIDLIRPLCDRYHCEFGCAIYLRYSNGESKPWIHLTSRYNELIKELKIEFDLDMYCLSNEGE